VSAIRALVSPSEQTNDRGGVHFLLTHFCPQPQPFLFSLQCDFCHAAAG